MSKEAVVGRGDVLRGGGAAFGIPATTPPDSGPRSRVCAWGETARRATGDRRVRGGGARPRHRADRRPHHPQTNGKREWFHRTPEEKPRHFGGLPEFITYYNRRGLHGSRDTNRGEIPLRTFHSRRAPDAIRTSRTPVAASKFQCQDCQRHGVRAGT